MGKGWDTLPAKEFGWAADVRRHPSDDVRRATANMRDGDVVEIEVPEIGVLRNPLMRER
jgi:2-keto-4-pentenoate hydratase/2-oxohepta-3-ene-1,7-dioic acid hydratase in catechol pathway